MENLIATGKLLLDEANYSKAKLAVWKMHAERTLESQYDEGIKQEFHRMLGGGSVIRPGMNIYLEITRPKIVNAIDFLESLQALDMPKQAPEPSHQTSPKTITVSGGTVVFGDNTTVNNITVKEILAKLEEDIEQKTPEGEDKKSALSTIRSLTNNETFSAVVGQTLGAFLSHTIK